MIKTMADLREVMEERELAVRSGNYVAALGTNNELLEYHIAEIEEARTLREASLEEGFGKDAVREWNHVITGHEKGIAECERKKQRYETNISRMDDKNERRKK
jgi:hypothetical protein